MYLTLPELATANHKSVRDVSRRSSRSNTQRLVNILKSQDGIFASVNSNRSVEPIGSQNWPWRGALSFGMALGYIELQEVHRPRSTIHTYTSVGLV